MYDSLYSRLMWNFHLHGVHLLDRGRLAFLRALDCFFNDTRRFIQFDYFSHNLVWSVKHVLILRLLLALCLLLIFRNNYFRCLLLHLLNLTLIPLNNLLGDYRLMLNYLLMSVLNLTLSAASNQSGLNLTYWAWSLHLLVLYSGWYQVRR